jgi:hypothetical protein
MSQLQIADLRWQRSRLEELTLTQNEVWYSEIMKLIRIFDLPAYQVSLI